MKKTCVVKLDKSGNSDLGMHIDALTLAVCLVEHGLVADWNAVNPGCAIEPGDRLVSVNGLCHPELVLEQLFGEPSLRIVVEKRGGFTGALVPHCKFSVELRRTALEGFGMDVSPDTMEVLNLQDDGKVALWNQCHPFRAIVIGDRIVEVNGAHTAKHDVFVSELNLELVVVRGSSIAMFGTFGVTLTVAGRLGFGVSPTMEVDKLEQDADQRWSAMALMSGASTQATSSMLAASHKFAVELTRTQGEQWGFEVSEDMQIKCVNDASVLAIWNWWHASRAVLPGDQLVELNGLSQSKAILDMLKGSSAIKMVLTRHGAIASTFGVKLAKTMGTKLGVKLSEDLEVLRIDAFGAVASWNVSNPLLSIHLGDRILQAAKLVSPDKIFASLQSEGELDLLVGRVERRLDASTGGICTYKECQAAYPDADLRWANMQRVPDTPEGFPATQYAADTDCHFLAYGAPKGESRDFLASESFYRTLADSRVPQHSPGRSLARLATPAALPETVATRSSFCCPCCNRLFHVFLNDGVYQAVAATGALAGIQLKPQQDWLLKAHDQVFTATLEAASLAAEIDQQSLKIKSIQEKGSITSWNLQNPRSAILVDDLIIEANGSRNQLFERICDATEIIQLVLARSFSSETYGVKLEKPRGKLGCQLSPELQVLHLKEGLLSEWNVSHPDSQVCCGDQIVQVNMSAQLPAMEAELSKLGSKDDIMIIMRRARQGTVAVA
ncbi:unnamed protein product [Durusdinium trenchii]|uniref:PDZ domain-containing protein n=1 Tax=Durusdinium trenchii TaxID=1381693 RepID=A0ABP0MW16_9DINO